MARLVRGPLSAGLPFEQSVVLAWHCWLTSLGDNVPQLSPDMEDAMAATTREAIRELLQQTASTIDTLLQASDEELSMPSSHGCAQGKYLWTLLTNDIDPDTI